LLKKRADLACAKGNDPGDIREFLEFAQAPAIKNHLGIGS
jgi:hypothetical protein